MSSEIRSLMVTAVVTATPEETIGEVRQKISQLHIGAVPVVSAAGTLLGIVTADDLVRDYEGTLPISRVMSEPVQTLSPDTDVGEAARVMRTERHHHVVVVEDDRIVGILSAFDLLRRLEERA